MTYTFKLSRRIARFRALLLAALLLPFAACDGGDTLSPDAGSPIGAGEPAGTPVAASTSFAGGIPMGVFGLPTTDLGSRYNGILRILTPGEMLSELAAIKSRGGKIVVSLAGSPNYYKNADGTFSLTKWKERVDRYRNINFSSYVTDGTIIGHYLIDEPQDKSNWNGTQVSQATVEAMAKYSKQYWPQMVTIVRSSPDYMDDWSGTYQYLDAAWAQYLIHRWPDVDAYISSNVSKAKAKGLALIVGLNVIKGGPTGGYMTGSQIKTYGSALLRSDYPCAFLSWKYESAYLSQSSVQDGMSALRSLAQSRPLKTCRGGSSSSEPAPEPSPEPDPAPEPPPPSAPTTGDALPFGLYQPSVDEYSTRWTGALFKASPTSLVGRLDRAAGAGMRLVVMLATPAQVRNSDGTFNLTKWKAQVDRYRTLPLSDYITSGAFYLHHLVDNPACASCWGGKAIPWETVEEMARYSKSNWPTLPTSARASLSQLASASFRWTYLDAGWAMYNTRRGDVSDWLARELGRAAQEGLGVVAGLNLLHASGPGSAAMTASQVKELGTALAGNTSVCAMVGWKYDANYLGQTGIRAALDSVTKVARSRPATSCAAS